MSLKVPYDALTLKIAMLGAANKIEAYEKKHGENSVLNKMVELGGGVPDASVFNKDAAAHHGISLEMYINSPNYTILREEYVSHLMRSLIEIMKNTFGLEDKEAWALALNEELSNS